MNSQVIQNCIILISLCFTVNGCNNEKPAEAAADRDETSTKKLNSRALRVEAISVESRTQALTVKLPGEVESARRARLASPTGGFVQKLFVRKGHRVKKGQDLAWINKDIAYAQLEQAEAQLELARHEMELVEAAGESMPRTRKVRTKAQLKTAQAMHKLAAINARRSRLQAPFAGVISRMNIALGEVIAPGQMVMLLENIDTVKVTVSISDRDIRWVRKGVQARVQLDGGSAAIDATVSRVSPSADLETRTFIAEIDLENKLDFLRPGMLGTVIIESEFENKAIAIPQYALLTRKEGNGVFVVENQKALWRPVQIGRLRGHSLVVLSGLKDGDELIIRGHRELNNGDEVLVVAAGGAQDK